MSEYLSKLTGMANTTVVPMIFQYIEKNEPQLEKALIEQLYKIRTTNPTEYNIFITNFRKICSAVEKSYTYAPPPPMSTPVATAPPPTGGFLGFGESGPSGPTGPSFVEQVTNFFNPSGPSGPTGPVGPTPTPEPTPVPETGFNVPSDVTTEPLPTTSEPEQTTEVGGKKKRHKRKTAKQHRKRTHRVKHKKH